MSEVKRQRILDKIRKLQAKTTAMGCTEAEALAAAQTIGKLLDDYGLSLSEVELQSTECIEDMVISPYVSNRHAIRYCLGAIAAYCHTEYFFRQTQVEVGWRTAYFFFGLPHDVDVAVYLTRVVLQAFERESAGFKRTDDYLDLSSSEKREALKSFRVGMAQRIRDRLCQMRVQRESDLQATGRDLVQVVGAVVSRAFAQAHPFIRTVNYNEYAYDALAYGHGVVAGGRVGLHPGVKEGHSPRQLNASGLTA